MNKFLLKNSINIDYLRLIPILLFIYSILPKLLGIIVPIKELEMGSSIFHFGEYFASATSIWNNSENIPITIHGGMDFLPAIIARLVFGSDNYFYPTIFLINLIEVITYALFFVLIKKICEKKNDLNSTFFLSMVAITSPFFFSVRDLFLLLTIYFLYNYLFDYKKSNNINSLYFLIFTTSFGLFWSFDRGIAGIITVFSSLFFRSLISKKIKDLNICLIILSVCLFLILITNFFGLINYFENVSFLFQTSSQWNYAWGFKTISAGIFICLFVFFAILITGKSFFLKRDRNFKSFWVGISFCALIMLRIAINRIDLQHGFFAMWAPIIISAFLLESKKTKLINGQIIFEIINISFILSTILIFLSKGREISEVTGAGMPMVYGFLLTGFSSFLIWLTPFQRFQRLKIISLSLSTFFLIFSIFLNLAQYKYIVTGNLKALKIITPIEFLSRGVNYSEIFPDTVWVSNQIINSKSECLLDMTNSGTINAGVDLPSCLTFAYPVYANEKFEKKIINDVHDKNINAIVYSTKYWNYAIDNKDMKKRFPKLDDFLIREFPNQKCGQNYCIRSK